MDPVSHFVPRPVLNGHPCDSAAPPAPSNRLYIGNLSWSTGTDELTEAFTPYGATEARVIMDRETGRSKVCACFAFAYRLFALVRLITLSARRALDLSALPTRPLRRRHSVSRVGLSWYACFFCCPCDLPLLSSLQMH